MVRRCFSAEKNPGVHVMFVSEGVAWLLPNRLLPSPNPQGEICLLNFNRVRHKWAAQLFQHIKCWRPVNQKVRNIFLFFCFCAFKLQFFISARSCNTTAHCGCVGQRRQDDMRAWHIIRMSPMNQPSRSLWHSLRRHRGKGESYIHFVLWHRQHLLVVGYSIHTTRTEPEHHCWQGSAPASWGSSWLCSLWHEQHTRNSLVCAAASTAPHLLEALWTPGFVQPWVGLACCCCYL